MLDYNKVDVQALMDISKAAEGELPQGYKFDMTVLLKKSFEGTRCNTAGCLLGTWMMANPNCGLKVFTHWAKNTKSTHTTVNPVNVAKRLGFPISDISYGRTAPSWDPNYYKSAHMIIHFLFFDNSEIPQIESLSATWLTRDLAIRRLRKVIYYILHKREIYQDREGRYIGDVGVAKLVKEDMEAVV